MANVNKIILVGTVTEKPTVKFGMENNTSLANFLVAAARPTRNDGSHEEDVIPVVAWGKNADYVAEYFLPGTIVIIEGRVQVRTTDNGGQREWITEVAASMVRAIDAKSVGQNVGITTAADSASPAMNQNPFDAGSTEDDIPF
jgi:single-strand DNA-binding protein